MTRRADRSIPTGLVERDRRLNGTLAQLDPEHLVTILTSASATARNAIITELGLEGRWKQLRFQQPEKAMRAMVPDIQRKISSYAGRQPFLVSRVLNSWWGRCALQRFGDLALPFDLGSIPQDERLVRVIHLVYDEETTMGETIRSRLQELERAAGALDRLFARLLLEHAMSPDAVDADRPLPQLAARGAAAEPRGLEPVEPGEIHVEPAPPDPVDPHEESATAPPTLPTSRPAQADATPPPDPLAPLRGALARYREKKSECVLLLDQGRHEELSAAALVAKQARHELFGQLMAVETRLKPYGLRLPSMQEAELASEPAVHEMLNRIDALIHTARELDRQRLAEEVNHFRAELNELGIEAPYQLSAVESRETLAQIRDLWREPMEEQRAFRTLQGDPDAAVHALAALSLDSRLRVYGRAAGTRDPDVQAAGIRALCFDMAAATSAPAPTLHLLAQLFAGLLDDGVLPPPGSWQFLARFNQGDMVGTLIEAGLLDRLDRSRKALQDPELQRLLPSSDERLPDALRRALERLEIRALPPDQQASRLAALALDPDADETDIEALLERLVEVGRFREALLLAVLLVRLGRRIASMEPVRTALLVVLIESAVDPSAIEIMRALVDDGLWLTHSDVDLAALLYLATSTRTSEWFDSARYARDSPLESAELSRPALFRHFQSLMLLNAGVEDDAHRRDQLARARQALAEWDHDIQKKSCYSGWDFYATKYQIVFRTRLTEAMTRLESREDPPLPSAEDILKEASRDLPAVEGDGRKSMLQYLEKQIERIRIISDALPLLEGERPLREELGTLGSTERRHRADLEQEASRNQDNPVLARIYKRVIEAIHEP